MITEADMNLPVTGFTLDLDGDHEAIQRLLSAVFHEMHKLRWESDPFVSTRSGPIALRLPPFKFEGEISVRRAVQG